MDNTEIKVKLQIAVSCLPELHCKLCGDAIARGQEFFTTSRRADRISFDACAECVDRLKVK